MEQKIQEIQEPYLIGFERFFSSFIDLLITMQLLECYYYTRE